MSVKRETLKKAEAIVAGYVPSEIICMAHCGCWGCGYGCSGTVGMG